MKRFSQTRGGSRKVWYRVKASDELSLVQKSELADVFLALSGAGASLIIEACSLDYGPPADLSLVVPVSDRLSLFKLSERMRKLNIGPELQKQPYC